MLDFSLSLLTSNYPLAVEMVVIALVGRRRSISLLSEFCRTTILGYWPQVNWAGTMIFFIVGGSVIIAGSFWVSSLLLCVLLALFVVPFLVCKLCSLRIVAAYVYVLVCWVFCCVCMLFRSVVVALPVVCYVASCCVPSVRCRALGVGCLIFMCAGLK